MEKFKVEHKVKIPKGCFTTTGTNVKEEYY